MRRMFALRPGVKSDRKTNRSCMRPVWYTLRSFVPQAGRHHPAVTRPSAVRREVELSLERLDDGQALPGFITLASDSENDIRARAVASLVNMHVPRALGIDAALMNLRERILSRSDRDLELLVEPDVPVDPAVVATLRARIGDSERGIRRSAIRGLGILRAAVAVPDLLQVVREDRDDALRFEAVRAPARRPA